MPQAKPHTLVLQVAVPLATEGQTFPTAPQFDGSLVVGMQVVPSAPYPGLHVAPHTPVVQAGAP